MDIESYFDFLAADDIRLRGTRVGIETVLFEYVHRRRSPEAIAEVFPSLSLEQVYATILYYLQHQRELDRYLGDWLEWGRQMRAEQRRQRPPFVEQLQTLRERQAPYDVSGRTGE